MDPKTARKITKSVVDRVPIPESGYTITRDTELRGFGVRVTANGARSFVMERRVKGRVKRFTVGRYGPEFTVEKARKKAEELAGEIASGKDPDEERRRTEAENVTLGDAVKAYLETRSLKPRTVEDVEEAMKGLESWKERRLTDLTAEKVLRRHKELSKASPARANLTMRYLRAVWNFARARYTTPSGEAIFNGNPVGALSELRAWNRVDRRKTVIKKDQLRPWFRAVLALQGVESRDLFLLLILTGLRRSEALGLTWEDVDLDERTLTIPDTKNREPHTLPLSDYLLELLKARKNVAKKGCPWVFAGASGERLVDPYRSVRAVGERSGVEFCLHDLRRTFATIAESLDLSSYAVKRLLNHATNADVTAGYIVTDTDRLREPMQRIEDTILRLGGVKGGGEVVELRRRKAT